MEIKCPNGHNSSDPDYCSECGSPIRAKDPDMDNPVNVDNGTLVCPDCKTPRDNGACFCEICRYDFQSRASYKTAVVHEATEKFDIIVKVDPSLIEEDEFKEICPKDLTDRIFPLDLKENLLGRRSVAKEIYPEIEIDDPGVSHRQLKFIKQDDGSFAVLELGSANGTKLNGTELKSGILTTVKSGDEFVIGVWTRLFICIRN